MATARHITLDKILEVEEKRTQLETHLLAYRDTFRKLKDGVLETNADSGDERDTSSDGWLQLWLAGERSLFP
jgi:hypothetical protein